MEDPQRTALNRWLNSIAADVLEAHLSQQRASKGTATVDQSAPPQPSRRERLCRYWAEIEEVAAKLRPHQQKVMELRYREGLTYREVANQLEVPTGTVHSRLARAKRVVESKLALWAQTDAATGARQVDEPATQPTVEERV